MSPRGRVFLTVGLASAAAAVITVGAVALQSDAESASRPEVQRPEGAPPLVLELGIRTDPEAVALRRAEQLYDDDRLDEAGEIFARYDSLDARIGAALAAWPDGTVRELQGLVRESPGRALVHLNFGFALFWDGRQAEAVDQWRAAKRVEPDSPSAVRADDLVHPNFASGLPHFVASGEPPVEIASLPADKLVAQLQKMASVSTQMRLFWGIALQRLGRPISARRIFDGVVRTDPASVEGQVAAAVARFDKAQPEAAFARLGPLARRYPRNPSVRFHLGLLLLWIGKVDEAERQLRLVDPKTGLGTEAKRLLDRLEKIGRK